MDTIAKNITIETITLSNFTISSTSFPKSKDFRRKWLTALQFPLSADSIIHEATQ
nr:MAG TPA: hypothetical protein [Caudoviricetes sp.]